MSEAPSHRWQFSIREMLSFTAVIATFFAAVLMFGWLNTVLIVLHPVAIFLYIAIFLERRLKLRMNRRGPFSVNVRREWEGKTAHGDRLTPR